jgi:hypothetical protein
VNCSDPTQPGVAAIQSYLKSLPCRPFNNGNCASGHFYQVDNQYPYYDHLGGVIQQGNEFPAGPAFAIGPQTIPTIGDSLSAANISWKYYGEGFSQAANQALANELYCAICNGFQYSRSIMTGQLKSNLQDLPSFFTDVSGGTLPAVSFVKPDILLDSHPGTSTPPLFEAFSKNIIQAVQQNPSLWQDTAILITFDESGGYYDSGYIQPIDFFGDGPRTVAQCRLSPRRASSITLYRPCFDHKVHRAQLAPEAAVGSQPRQSAKSRRITLGAVFSAQQPGYRRSNGDVPVPCRPRSLSCKGRDQLKFDPRRHR